MSIQPLSKRHSTNGVASEMKELEELMRRELFPEKTGRCTYAYAALPDPSHYIRLFILHPGKPQTPLRGDIVTVHIAKLPVYNALSYCWGSAKKSHQVITDEGTIYITSSLSTALHRLRLSDRSQNVWVDALCIDQKNNTEKGRQIPLMGIIYSRATQVIAYLGPEAQGSSSIGGLLHQIAGSSLSITDESGKGVTKISSLEKLGLPVASDDIWIPYHAFWSRSWFRRMWIIQEFLLARDINFICGEWECNWMTLFEACSTTTHSDSLLHSLDTRDNAEVELATRGAETFLWMAKARTEYDFEHAYPDFDPSTSSNLSSQEKDGIKSVLESIKGLTMFRVAGTFGPYQRQDQTAGTRNFVGMNLMDAIHSTCGVEVTDPRDRFFALMGLTRDVSPWERDSLEADYSHVVKDIMCQYAAVLMRKGHCMDILYRAGIGDTPPGLPSMYGYWMSKRRKPWEQKLGVVGKDIYHASGKTETSARVAGKKGSLLVVAGCVLDSIVLVGSGPILKQQSDTAHLTMTSNFAEIDEIFSSVSCPAAGEEALEEAKWRTLIANKTTEGKIPDPEAMRSQYQALRRHFRDAPSQPLSNEKTETNTHRSATYVQALQAVQEYKPCVTARGYAGLVPLATEVGDKVAILCGGNVPFMLRDGKHKKRAKYQLVGGCYIHGWMDGEAMGFEDWKRDEITLY